MKIGIYLGRFPVFEGGIWVYANEILKNCEELLRSAEFQSMSIVFYGDDTIFRDKLENLLPLFVSASNLHNSQKIVFKKLPALFGRRFGYILDYFLIPVAAWFDSIDLLHSVSNIGFPIRRSAQLVTVHDLFQAWPNISYAKEFGDSLLSIMRKRFVRLMYRCLFAIQFRALDYYIADSEDVADSIEKIYKIDRENIVVIPLGVDRVISDCLYQFKKDRERFSKMALNWCQKNNICLGYLGIFASADPRKNTPRMLDAWLELPDDIKSLGLVIVMSDPRVKDIAFNFKNRVGGKWQITILSRLSRCEIPIFLFSSGIFLNATLEEGFGLPNLEAASLGVQVVVGNREANLYCDQDVKFMHSCDPCITRDITQAIIHAHQNRKSSRCMSYANVRAMKQVVEDIFRLYPSFV